MSERFLQMCDIKDCQLTAIFMAACTHFLLPSSARFTRFFCDRLAKEGSGIHALPCSPSKRRTSSPRRLLASGSP